MANGSEIPYQLRPNKFIDRQIFIELLSKIVPQKQHGNYVYISMGGKHLVDQEAVYRKIGLSNLCSFDYDGDIVARQECNRPHFNTRCEELDSGDLPGSLERILGYFPGAQHMIIWLDYTDTQRLAQLQQFTEVLKRCQPGDVVRVTLNAYERTLAANDWQTEGFPTPSHCRAKKLRDQIGDYFPADVDRILQNEMPSVLAGAVAIAAAKAEAETRTRFLPVFLASYADGQRMFTATVLCVAEDRKLIDGLKGWEFLAKDWSKITEISVPDLSIREKVAIDKLLSRGPKAIIKALKFKPASELDDAHLAIGSYKRLHRFYPTFHAIGVQ
jgi:hypothetical protein